MSTFFRTGDGMGLREFLVFKRMASDIGARKCRCPFHGNDLNPSCYMNDNHIYCYTCNRSYTIHDFNQYYNVELKYQDQTNELVHNILNGGVLYPPNAILFRYPFGKLK